MPDLVLSSSSVQTYLNCHLQWWFEYMAAIPGTRNEAMEVGIATHTLVEEYLLAKLGPVPAFNPAERVGHVWKEADRLLQVYPVSLIDPWLVEAQYQYEIGGILYQSILDVAEKDGVVRDLKTTSKRPSRRSDRYRISMTGHALGFRVLTDMIETNIVVDYVVRTKTAYHWPVELGQLSDDDVDLFEATLQGVAEGIDKADFEPTGLESSWACAGCIHAAHCGPYQRFKEVTGA